MPKTVVREKESIEDALRRFKRDVSKSGNLQEARKREFYVKPSVERKDRARAARAKKKVNRKKNAPIRCVFKSFIIKKSTSVLFYFFSCGIINTRLLYNSNTPSSSFFSANLIIYMTSRSLNCTWCSAS